jgi:hypothetical protein
MNQKRANPPKGYEFLAPNHHITSDCKMWSDVNKAWIDVDISMVGKLYKGWNYTFPICRPTSGSLI